MLLKMSSSSSSLSDLSSHLSERLSRSLLGLSLLSGDEGATQETLNSLALEAAKIKEQNKKAKQELKEWRAEIKKVSFKTFCKDCEDVGKSGGYRNQGAKQELSCLRNGRHIQKGVKFSVSNLAQSI